jgi:DNA-binding CsgD family transcriptional regulator
VVRSAKFFGDEAFHATRLYRKVLQPIGFGHFMQMKLGHHGERFIYLFLSFREDTPDVRCRYDDLFRLLTLLAPHIVRASEIARAMRLSREVTQLLSGSLDTVLLPMALVDPEGVLIHANAAGARCIARGGILSTDGARRLTLPAPHETREFRARLRAAVETGRPAGLHAHEGGSSFALLAIPLPLASDREAGLDLALFGRRGAAAVFAGQLEADAVNAGLLSDAFDLTPREAAICCHLLDGRGPAEIARETGRSVKTVRNQIQTVYAKLEVGTLRALMDRLIAFRTAARNFDDAAAHAHDPRAVSPAAGPAAAPWRAAPRSPQGPCPAGPAPRAAGRARARWLRGAARWRPSPGRRSRRHG